MSDSASKRARLKQESLTCILDAGAARLRVEGLEGAAIAPVMQDAGLTHGAFYSHFASKDELAIAAFRHALTENRQRWIGKTPDRSWSERMARLAPSYLNRTHRDDRADSCTFSALATDAPGRRPSAAQPTSKSCVDRSMRSAITRWMRQTSMNIMTKPSL